VEVQKHTDPDPQYCFCHPLPGLLFLKKDGSRDKKNPPQHYGIILENTFGFGERKKGSKNFLKYVGHQKRLVSLNNIFVFTWYFNFWPERLNLIKKFLRFTKTCKILFTLLANFADCRFRIQTIS
jgi:hypothetical protein